MTPGSLIAELSRLVKQVYWEMNLTVCRDSKIIKAKATRITMLRYQSDSDLYVR